MGGALHYDVVSVGVYSDITGIPAPCLSCAACLIMLCCSGSWLSPHPHSSTVSFSGSQQHNSGPSQSHHSHHSGPHHSGPHSGPCASISGTISAMVPLAVAQHGWQLTSSRTTPGLQEAADAEGSSIEWGELLGGWRRQQRASSAGLVFGPRCLSCMVWLVVMQWSRTVLTCCMPVVYRACFALWLAVRYPASGSHCLYLLMLTTMLRAAAAACWCVQVLAALGAFTSEC
jgi:hypothetical protein